ncbi:MAG: ROK family protein [Terrimicrobiaceae bacterium]
MKNPVYLGIDCGATTSKVGGVDESGEPLSIDLRQSDTCGEGGPEAIIHGWMNGAEAFLSGSGISWDRVAGVGLAIPGPYLGYGILGPMPNLPSSLTGWHFLKDLRAAVANAAGRLMPVETANDGQLAGLPEARIIQKTSPGSVLMLAPGSGLGCSFVDASGRVFLGDHQAGVIICHMPAPYEQLGLPLFGCGCGRTWGCFEAYTSISGLPHLLAHFLPKYPCHPLGGSDFPTKKQVLALRGLAQEGDPLALEIFDTQAAALGMAVAAASMAYDPSHVVIGGGLMDKTATTPDFRRRYLKRVESSAAQMLWTDPGSLQYHEAVLGELSQCIGAALMIRSLVAGV